MNDIDFTKLKTVSGYAKSKGVDKKCIWHYIEFLNIRPIERKLKSGKTSYWYLSDSDIQDLEKFFKENDTNSRKKLLQATTLKQRYGDSHYNNRDKMRETITKNHGNPNFRNHEKARQTKKLKYGDEFYTNHEKGRETCKKKFGVEFAAQNSEIKQKTKQYFLEKYGVDHPMRDPRVKQKFLDAIQNSNRELANIRRVETCRQKYGVEHVAQLPTVIEKQRETFFKNFGTYRLQTYRYVYENLKFDSSWELAVWIWAKDHNKNIKHEPTEIQFDFEGRRHLYIPDFEIDDQLIEVKGDHFFNTSGELICPYNSKLNNLYREKQKIAIANNVVFWTSKDLKPILDYIQEKYGKSFLSNYRIHK